MVFFCAHRAHLERRFEGLKATLDPADGLWIAWPKKAAKLEGNLTFEAVQEIGLAHGLVDNKSRSIERRGFDSPREHNRCVSRRRPVELVASLDSSSRGRPPLNLITVLRDSVTL